jgi:hypothetical protein
VIAYPEKGLSWRQRNVAQKLLSVPGQKTGRFSKTGPYDVSISAPLSSASNGFLPRRNHIHAWPGGALSQKLFYWQNNLSHIGISAEISIDSMVC